MITERQDIVHRVNAIFFRFNFFGVSFFEIEQLEELSVQAWFIFSLDQYFQQQSVYKELNGPAQYLECAVGAVERI